MFETLIELINELIWLKDDNCHFCSEYKLFVNKRRGNQPVYCSSCNEEVGSLSKTNYKIIHFNPF